MEFLLPRTWAARMMNWCWAEIRVSLMMSSDWERPLFRISTAVWLSEWMRITFLDHSCSQRRAAMTTGLIEG